MIVRAAVCPSPPLLARQLTGQADVFPELRTACAASVERALRDGDMAALASLEPSRARDLLATGRPAWQVLAGAMSAAGTVGGPAGQLLCADAPLGVGYFVAVLDPP